MYNHHYHFGIVGATGAVGQEMVRLLEKRRLPVASLRCFASPRSLGKTIPFRGEKIPVALLNEESFQGIDIALFCAGSKISLAFAPLARSSGAIVIDSSSAFRNDPQI